MPASRKSELITDQPRQRQNADTDTITITVDPYALLAAEDALLPYLPDDGIPDAQPFFDLMGRVHRSVSQPQRYAK